MICASYSQVCYLTQIIDNLYCKYAHSPIQHIICNRNVFTNFLPCSHAINPNNETCLVTCAMYMAFMHTVVSLIFQPVNKYIIGAYLSNLYCMCIRMYVCILVRRKIKEKSVHTSALEAQFTDVCTVHQTGFIVRINCVRTRQEISKHISIAYNMLYWTMRIFAV